MSQESVFTGEAGNLARRLEEITQPEAKYKEIQGFLLITIPDALKYYSQSQLRTQKTSLSCWGKVPQPQDIGHTLYDSTTLGCPTDRSYDPAFILPELKRKNRVTGRPISELAITDCLLEPLTEPDQLSPEWFQFAANNLGFGKEFKKAAKTCQEQSPWQTLQQVCLEKHRKNIGLLLPGQRLILQADVDDVRWNPSSPLKDLKMQIIYDCAHILRPENLQAPYPRTCLQPIIDVRRTWDPESWRKIQQYAATQELSELTWHRITSESLAHPLNGGLPGLGKNN